MRSEALTLDETTSERTAALATEVAARSRLRTVRSRLRLVRAFGRAHTIREWAAFAGVRPDTMRKRLARGLPAEVAILLPGDVRHVDPAARCGGPNSWTWELLDFEDDDWVRRFIRDHRGGASLERIGAAWGLTKEQIRHIEERAVAKLRQAVEKRGDQALLAWLAELAEAQREREEP